MTDSRTREVYDWTILEHNSRPTPVLREFDIEVGGIFRLVSRGEACDAKLSEELKVESVCTRLPADLESGTQQHFWTTMS